MISPNTAYTNIFTSIALVLSVAIALNMGVNIGVAQSADEAAEEEPPIIKVESGNPMSGNEDAIKAGRKLYKRWCQQCHGVKLDGYSPRWGKHGADLRKFWGGYAAFVNIVQNGNVEKLMPPHKEYLTGEDVLSIGAFIETKAIEGAVWK